MSLLIISRRVPCEKYTSLYLEDITGLLDSGLERLVKSYLIGSYHIESDTGEHFDVDKDISKIIDTIKKTYWSTTFKDTEKSEITFRIMSAEIASAELKIK